MRGRNRSGHIALHGEAGRYWGKVFQSGEGKLARLEESWGAWDF